MIVMSLFAIADLHLSLGTDKPMDVFSGWKDYVSRLEKNWRSVVTENDTVVIGGDISWAMKLQETYADFQFIHSLPGRKLLLKGNHDYWWCTKKKMDAFLCENGFDSMSILFNNAYAAGGYAVCGTRGWYYDAENDADKKVLHREVGRLKTSIEQARSLQLEPVVFLHYPPVYANTPCKEIMDVLLHFGIRKCYYGHVHGGNAAKRAQIGVYAGISFDLVACDYLKFMPRLIR